MQTVLDVQIPAWLLVPAEHQVVEIQKGKAVVSLTNCPNDIVCSPHPVNLKPAERTRLDPDVENAGVRELCQDCAHEALEVYGNLFGDLSTADVVVTGVDDDKSGLVSKHQPVDVSEGVR